MVKKRWQTRTWLKEPGFLYVVLLCYPLVISSCSGKEAKQEKKRAVGPVRGITTSLEDEVEALPDEQISWSTYWKLCWEEYPEAEAYEIQTVTSEGSSPKVKKIQQPCYRLQIAAGKNKKSQGLMNRNMLIGLQSGQIAYKVRAVLGKNTYSPWSKPMQVQQAANKTNPD